MTKVLFVLPPTYCFFFLFFNLCHISISTTVSTPRYVAVENIALNCGDSSNSTGRDGRKWIGDKDSKIFQNDRYSYPAPKSAPHVSVPYRTARISQSQFTYVFPVTPGPKFVRLHFYSGDYLDVGGITRLIFTVNAGSYTLFAYPNSATANNTFQLFAKSFVSWYLKMNKN